MDGEVRIVSLFDQPPEHVLVRQALSRQGEVRWSHPGRRGVVARSQGTQLAGAHGRRSKIVERSSRLLAVRRAQPAVGEVADGRVSLVLQQPRQETTEPVDAAR